MHVAQQPLVGPSDTASDVVVFERGAGVEAVTMKARECYSNVGGAVDDLKRGDRPLDVSRGHWRFGQGVNAELVSHLDEQTAGSRHAPGAAVERHDVGFASWPRERREDEYRVIVDEEDAFGAQTLAKE